MKKLLFLILGTLCMLQSVSAMADDFSFTGNLGFDDDVQFFNFTVGVTSTVTMRTYSYAGGTNADGDVIPAGGFDPILALFDADGLLIDQNDDGDGVPTDPVSGSAWDTLLALELTPGNYTVAVSQYSNFAIGPTLADGFEGSGTSGFVDDGGYTRTSFWAFDVLNVTGAEVVDPLATEPVPTLSQWMTLLLVLTLLTSGAWAGYRRKILR